MPAGISYLSGKHGALPALSPDLGGLLGPGGTFWSPPPGLRALGRSRSGDLLPVPLAGVGAAGVESEGKRDWSVPAAPGAEARTAVSILLIPPEFEWQRQARNQVYGLHVPVLTCSFSV